MHEVKIFGKNFNDLITNRVHFYYWEKDYNCAITTMKILSEIFSDNIQEQVYEAALGMHGAGKYGAQCGLVEGTIMFIGIFGCKNGLTCLEIETICYDYASCFQKKFGSLLCRELRPQGFNPENPPHLCEELTAKSIKFAYKYIEEKIIIGSK